MPVSKLVKKLVRRTGVFFVIFLAAWIVPMVVVLPPRWGRALEWTAVVALLCQAILWANSFIGHWTDVYIERHQTTHGDATTIRAVGGILRVAIWAILVLLAFEALGKNVTGLVAGLGVGGIAVAFALQNILADLFGAFSIVLDKPFVVGDAIQVDGLSGTVQRIGLKSTRVRSDSGEEIVFANGELLKGKLRNFGRMEERRAILVTRVDGDTPPEKLAAVPAILRAAVEAQRGVRFARSHLKDVGDATFDFETVYYLARPDYALYMDAQQAVILETMRRLAAEGIELAVQLEAAQKQKIAGRDLRPVGVPVGAPAEFPAESPTAPGPSAPPAPPASPAPPAPRGASAASPSR